MTTTTTNIEPKNNKIIICGKENLLINLLSNRNDNTPILLTGKAGTGKSTLINYLKGLPLGKKCIYLAPTGIAALNIKGVTIHKFFGIPAIDLATLPINDIAIRYGKSDNAKALANFDIIIIDEISMVRADMLDLIDLCLKKALSIEIPFGGKKVVLVGDPYQLPPIVKDDDLNYLAMCGYESEFFFSSKVISQNKPYLIELDKIHRQQNPYFIDILNKIRIGAIDAIELKEFNYKVLTQTKLIQNKFSILVSTTNKIADNYNHEKLISLKGNKMEYKAVVEGLFPETLRPAPELLELKVGAQIMFVNNDVKQRWQNGTIGKIIELNPDNVLVQKQDGTFVDASICEFQNLTVSNGEIISLGYYYQIPLKLAWAVTIHKSQGLTFENVTIDLGRGAFANGQTYVALSRCKSIEGLRLNDTIKRKDIKVHPILSEYKKKFVVLEVPIDNKNIKE